jgi:hypothetical protein
MDYYQFISLREQKILKKFGLILTVSTHECELLEDEIIDETIELKDYIDAIHYMDGESDSNCIRKFKKHYHKFDFTKYDQFITCLHMLTGFNMNRLDHPYMTQLFYNHCNDYLHLHLDEICDYLIILSV